MYLIIDVAVWGGGVVWGKGCYGKVAPLNVIRLSIDEL